MDRSVPALFALLGAVLGTGSVLQQFAPVVFPVPVTAAATYVFAIAALLFLVSPVVAFAVGYWTGGRIDVPREYAAFTGIAAATAAVGFLVAYGGVTILLLSGRFGPSNLLRFGLGLFFRLVETATEVGLVALAGAAVHRFRRERKT